MRLGRDAALLTYEPNNATTAYRLFTLHQQSGPLHDLNRIELVWPAQGPTRLQLSRSENSSLAESYHVNESVVGEKTLKTMREILHLLSEYPLSQVTSSDEGEVAFYWFKNGNKIDAYLDQNGYFTWIGKFNGSYDQGGDQKWQNKLPDAFVRMLNRLFE